MSDRLKHANITEGCKHPVFHARSDVLHKLRKTWGRSFVRFSITHFVGLARTGDRQCSATLPTLPNRRVRTTEKEVTSDKLKKACNLKKEASTRRKSSGSLRALELSRRQRWTTHAAPHGLAPILCHHAPRCQPAALHNEKASAGVRIRSAPAPKAMAHAV